MHTVGHGARPGAELFATLVAAGVRTLAELLTARGYEVVHLLRPGESRPHEPWTEAEAREGRLYLCGHLVA